MTDWPCSTICRVPAGRVLLQGVSQQALVSTLGADVRRLSGLGEVDLRAGRRSTPKRYDFCDVLVIGAGPSGLGAALAAAGRGASVLLSMRIRTRGQRLLCARRCDRDAGDTAALLAAVRADSGYGC